MEIVGKIIQILPKREGISAQGKPWVIQPFKLETLDQYPRMIYIEIFGEERIKSCPLDIDHVVTVGVDIESREFNGRYYTSVRAWKVTNGDGTQQQVAQTTAAPAGGPIYPDANPPAYDPNAGTDNGTNSLFD